MRCTLVMHYLLASPPLCTSKGGQPQVIASLMENGIMENRILIEIRRLDGEYSAMQLIPTRHESLNAAFCFRSFADFVEALLETTA